MMMDRRLFILAGSAAAAAGLTGCSTTRDMSFTDSWFGSPAPVAARDGATLGNPNYDQIYGAYSGEPFPVLRFDYTQVDPVYLRQEVAYTGPEAPGTVVIDPSSRHLYFVEPGRRATRYGVGVGREGFAWHGTAQINMRRSWPDWIPPREMVARDPEIRAQLVSTARGEGVPGGSRSPLGARAMYLFSEHGDTGYRIHGTTEPETIGTNVSSGCIRMVNQDVIHLYGRAPDGTIVVVLG